MVELLISRGADADATGGYDDQTALHAAAWRDGRGRVRRCSTGARISSGARGGCTTTRLWDGRSWAARPGWWSCCSLAGRRCLGTCGRTRRGGRAAPFGNSSRARGSRRGLGSSVCSWKAGLRAGSRRSGS
ncbi:MAG: hypothetical protein IPJ41_12060 [Phycisphaerales bacterium]|nr:hypothetical protein [Phycisphaerales bacterium]